MAAVLTKSGRAYKTSNCRFVSLDRTVSPMGTGGFSSCYQELPATVRPMTSSSSISLQSLNQKLSTPAARA